MLFVALDPSLITQGLNIAFFVLVGLIVLSGLFGLIQGVWKASFHLIFVGTLIALSFIMLKPLTNILADLSLTGILEMIGMPDLAITINNTPVPVTTLRETISGLIEAAYQSMGLDPNASAETAALVTGFTLVILRYVVFIILGTVISLVGDVLASIFYFLFFRYIIPKPIRKKVKIRWLGMLENMVKTGLVMTMIMIPFTAMFNSVLSAFRDPNNPEVGIDDPTYQQIMGFIDAYDDSLLAQVLFNWSMGEDGKTLDVLLMDFATSETLGETELVLSNEISMIAGIGKTVLSSGILSSENLTEVYTSLLDETVITSLFTNLQKSGLIISVLPLAVTLALNIDQVQSLISPDIIEELQSDMGAINYKEELANIQEIFVEVSRSGLITDILESADSGGANGLTSAVLETLLDADSRANVRNALQLIDNSEFMSLVLPAVLYSVANQESDPADENAIPIKDFLPPTWDELKDIHWGSEMTIVYDTLYRIANIDQDFVPILIETMGPSERSREAIDAVSNSGTLSSGESITPSHQPYGQVRGGTNNIPSIQKSSEITSEESGEKTLISIILDNVDEVTSILVGDFDNAGLPMNIDADTGKTDITIPDAEYCLFDSDLLAYGFDALIDLVVNNLGDSNEFISTEDIEDAVELLNSAVLATKRVNYKTEFNALFEIVATLVEDETIMSIIDGSASPDADLLSSANTRATIKSITTSIDRSVIISKILPGIIENSISGIDGLDELGLSVDDFNFRVDNFGTELGKLIDGYTSIMTVVENFTGEGTDPFEQLGDPENTQALTDLLELFYSSKILNPDVRVAYDDYEIGDRDNRTFFKLIEFVFDQAATATDNSINVAEVMATARDVDAWTDEEAGLGQQGEISHLINVFSEIGNSDLLSAMSEANPLDAIDSQSIANVFAAIGRSDLMSACFGDVLDHFLGDVILDSSIPEMSFNNVSNWEEEGLNLKIIIENIQAVNIDLNNFDIMAVDAARLTNVLNGLADSKIFVSGNDYFYGDYLYNKIVGNGALGSYLYDYNEDDTSPSPYDTTLSDFALIGKTIDDIDAWKEQNGRVTDVMAALQDIDTGDPEVDALTFISSGDATFGQLEPVVQALNQVGIFRMILPNVLNDITSGTGFQMGTISLSDANFYVLVGGNAAINHSFTTYTQLMDFLDFRADEIDSVLNVYEQIENLGLNGTTPSIDTIGGDDIRDLFSSLHGSQIFNTYKGDSANTTVREYDGLLPRLTVFEQIIRYMLDVSGLDAYVVENYNSLTPTQQQNALTEKVAAISNGFANPVNESTDRWINGIDYAGVTYASATVSYTPEVRASAGEINRFANIVDALKATGLNFTNLGGNAIMDAINEKNISQDYIVGTSIVLLDYLGRNVYFNYHDATNDLYHYYYFTDVPNAQPDTDGNIHYFYIDADAYNNLASEGTRTFILTNHDKDAMSEVVQPYLPHDEGLYLGSGKARLDALLISVNNAELTMRAIPNLISDILGSNMLDFGDVNLNAAYVNYAIDRHEADPMNVPTPRFEYSEMTELTTAFRHIQRLVDQVSDLTDISSFTGDVVTTIEDVLLSLNDMKMFHLAGLDPDYSDGNMTVLQELIYEILDKSTFIDFLFDAASPKDIDRGYLSKTDKAESLILSIFDSITGNRDERRTQISALTNVFDVFINAPSLSGISNFADANLYTSLSADDLESLLLAINDSTLVYDAVPTILNRAFTDASISISGVSLGAANVYFPYYFDASGAPRLTPDFDQPYPELEISLIANAYESVETLSDNVTGFDNLTSLSSTEVDYIRQVLLDFNETYVFHLGGLKAGYVGDKTVLQQLVYSMIDNTSFDELIFNATSPKDLNSGYAPGDELVKTNDIVLAEFDTALANANERQTKINDFVNIFDVFLNAPSLSTVTNFNDANLYSLLTASDLADLLGAINDSVLVYDAVPSLLNRAFTDASMDISGVDLSAANVYFPYYMDENGVPRGAVDFNQPYPTSEIVRIADAYASVETLSDNVSSFSDLTTFNHTQVDYIRQVLLDFNPSFVFHLGGLKVGAAGDKTVLQQLIYSMMDNTNFDDLIFNASSPKDIDSGYVAGEALIKTSDIVKAEFDLVVGNASERETNIDDFMHIFDVFIDSGSLSAVTDFSDSSMYSSLTSADLNDLLTAINDSVLVYDAVPTLLNRAFTDASMDVSGVNLNAANVYFPYYFDALGNARAPIFTERYPASEIARIANAFDSVATLSDNVPSFDNLTSFTTTEVDYIRQVLLDFNESYVFHLGDIKPGYIGDKTVLQQLLYSMVDNTGFDDLIFNASGPKDTANGYILGDASVKTNDIILDEFDIILANANYREVEIEAFMHIFDVFVTSSSLNTATNIGDSSVYSAISSTDLENLLLAINDSVMVYDAVPNLLNRTFTDASLSVEGVDLAAANVYFTYDFDEFGVARLVTDYNARYPEDEIGLIADIYLDMKGGPGVTGLSTIAGLFDDITAVNEDDLLSLETTLDHIRSSLVFHQTDVDAAYDAGLLPGETALTVFEQTIVQILDTSTLGSLAFDVANHPSDAVYSNAKDKLIDRVDRFEALKTSESLLNQSWQDEISDLINLIRVNKLLFPANNSAGFSATGLSSENMMIALNALNQLNTIYDATAKMMRQGFENISIATYTEGSEEYYIGQKAYDDVAKAIDVTYVAGVPDSVALIDVAGVDTDGKDLTYISNLLASFEKDDGMGGTTYIDMGAPGFNFKTDFLDEGKSSSDLMAFLDQTEMMASTTTYGSALTRSTMFYNLLATSGTSGGGLSGYVRGATKTAKIEKIDEIFDHNFYTGIGDEFNYLVEGKAFDAMMANLDSLAGSTDSDDLDGQGEVISNVVLQTFGYQANGTSGGSLRAYFASELSAGFFEDALEGEYAVADAKLASLGSSNTAIYIDWYANDYEFLNVREADGFKGGLSAFADVSSTPRDATWQNKVRADFTMMGSLADCYPDGLANPWVNGNSRAAQLLYMSLFMRKAGTINLGMFTLETLIIGAGYEDSYEADFVFENVGEYIATAGFGT